MLVISDDTALAVGRLRIRKGGSAGGHNGLKSIIQHLGTDQFPASGWVWAKSPTRTMIMADWVLGKFQGGETPPPPPRGGRRAGEGVTK